MHEHVDRTGAAVLAGCAEQRGVPTESHRGAELVADGGVAGSQPGLLAPGRPAAHEHVGCPAAAVLLWCPYQRGSAAQGHGGDEVVNGGGVAGSEPGLLVPGRPAAYEHVGCPAAT